MKNEQDDQKTERAVDQFLGELIGALLFGALLWALHALLGPLD